MSLINSELIAIGRINLDYQGSTILAASYDFSDGFDAVEVDGAQPGAAPIFVDGRANALGGVVLFLTDPTQPGTSGATPNQGGLKATFSIVSVSTPSDPLPVQSAANSYINWQYGDYTLAGTTSPALATTPYAKVDPQKALRVKPQVFAEGRFSIKVDVSVFRNPVTLYKY